MPRFGWKLAVDAVEMQHVFDVVDSSRDGEIGFAEFVDLLAGEQTAVQQLVSKQVNNDSTTSPAFSASPL